MTRIKNVKLASKLFPTKDVGKIDTAADNRIFHKNNRVLMDAFNAWQSLDSFRRMALRNKRYTFSDQWGDMIADPDGMGMIRERDLIARDGNTPLQNNRIRGIVRSVVGLFQSSQTEPVCISRDRDEQGSGELMSVTMQYVYQLNKLWGIDSNNLNYFLITGLACFKSTFGYRNNKMDVWTDIVNYNNIFFDNHMEDTRHWDCHIIGQIYDVGLYDVMGKFSNGSKEKADEIRNIYSYCNKEQTMSYIDNLVKDTKKDINFFVPQDDTRCRVIEIWKKEAKERLLCHDRLSGDFYKCETEEEADIKAENEKRTIEQTKAGVQPKDLKLIEYQWFVDNYWYYYFMSPQGDVLDEGETPYWHESHPYSFKIYPFYDKQVFPFVSGFIDQQRYINRLITMQDFIMRSSAKGVLMFPEDSKPDDMSMDEIADTWASYNGIIYYKPKPGVSAPQQIITNSSNTGAYDMLNVQLKLLEDISGVQGALQGQTPKSGTPAALYIQQTQNAAVQMNELMDAYRELREDRDMKNLKLVQQFYTEPKYINISGDSYSKKSTLYDPDKVRNAEFDLSITESTSTPTYRMITNDFLMQIFQTGQIALEDMLDNGYFPFADKLKQSISKRKMEMEEEQEKMAKNGGQLNDPSGAMTQTPDEPFVPQDIMGEIQNNAIYQQQPQQI